MRCTKLVLFFALSLTLTAGCGALPGTDGYGGGASYDGGTSYDGAASYDGGTREIPPAESAADAAPSPAPIADPTLPDLHACRIDPLRCPPRNERVDKQPLPLPPVVDPVPAERVPGTALVDGLEDRALTKSLSDL
jgi:hypothetical protein